MILQKALQAQLSNSGLPFDRDSLTEKITDQWDKVYSALDILYDNPETTAAVVGAIIDYSVEHFNAFYDLYTPEKFFSFLIENAELIQDAKAAERFKQHYEELSNVTPAQQRRDEIKKAVQARRPGAIVASKPGRKN